MVVDTHPHGRTHQLELGEFKVPRHQAGNRDGDLHTVDNQKIAWRIAAAGRIAGNVDIVKACNRGRKQIDVNAAFDANFLAGDIREFTFERGANEFA